MTECSLTTDEMAEYDRLCLRYDAIGDMDPEERDARRPELDSEQRWIEARLARLDRQVNHPPPTPPDAELAARLRLWDEVIAARRAAGLSVTDEEDPA
jgi:hypothetical protein